MKYDCTKTRDCIHEYHRLCDSYPAGCESDCPLFGVNEICGIDTFENEAFIALLQQWSDEHPEKPKLTKREHEFLKIFLISRDKAIVRGELMNDLYIHYARHDTYFAIDPTMFSFILEEEQMTFDELLKLEVEE